MFLACVMLEMQVSRVLVLTLLKLPGIRSGLATRRNFAGLRCYVMKIDSIESRSWLGENGLLIERKRPGS